MAQNAIMASCLF